MVAVVAKFAAFLALTIALIPVQAAALRWGLPYARRLPTAYHRLLCRLLGIRIRQQGNASAATPLLVVANHVSYLDILVLTACAPVVFVAKREVGTWPLFGLLARLQRTIFVDRERRRRTGETTGEIAGRLADGEKVVVFAEGTSSAGAHVLAFRSSLIGAVEAIARNGGEVFVQPAAIAYTGIDGLPIDRAARPRLAWYGDMDLLPHLKGVMRLSAIDVTVAWGEPVACRSDTDRKHLTRDLEARVRGLLATALRQG